MKPRPAFMFFLIIFVPFATQIFAQPTNELIVIGQKAKLYSKVLNEERNIWIYTPTGYDNSDFRYPVVYLLDGPGHFHHATGLVEYLSQQNLMPRVILVAVANTDRTRDMTPPTRTDTTARFPNAGGADDFIKFFQNELFPYIEKNYRTESYRILIGHSFGGLFAVHALLSEPSAFNAYISISPSLWWNDHTPLKEMKAALQENRLEQKFLYVSMGNEGGEILASAQEFTRILEEQAPEEFEWSFELMDMETHGSIPHRSIYNALEKLYQGWQIPNLGELADAGGLEAVDKHYETLSAKYGYKIITPENVVNQLGYRYLARKEYEKAIAIFKRNVEVYPKSANVYDSLGDGYDASQQSQMALKNYRRAVEIAEKSGHPNLEVYQKNKERLEKQIGGNQVN